MSKTNQIFCEDEVNVKWEDTPLYWISQEERDNFTSVYILSLLFAQEIFHAVIKKWSMIWNPSFNFLHRISNVWPKALLTSIKMRGKDKNVMKIEKGLFTQITLNFTALQASSHIKMCMHFHIYCIQTYYIAHFKCTRKDYIKAINFNFIVCLRFFLKECN